MGQKHGSFVAALVLAVMSTAGRAGEIGDLAARIEYGYYAEQAGVIVAARDELDHSRSADPLSVYYRAYAAMRLAQLHGPDGRRREDALSDCITGAESLHADGHLKIEALVLVAACSELAAERESLRSVLHERRAQQALAAAQALHAEHPRLRLVESGVFRSSGATPTLDEATLEETLAAFQAWPHPFQLPDWGEAEVLAAIGATRLARDDIQGARDFIEQALFVAPDYRVARDLELKLKAPASGYR